MGRGWETVCGGAHPEIYALDRRVKHSGRFSQRMTCQGYHYRWEKGGGYCYGVDSGREVRHPVPTQLGLQAIAQTTARGAIKPGKTYICTAWVKIQGLTQSWEWFRLGVYWLGANGRFISEVREDHDADKGNYGTQDWKQVHVAPPNAAFAKVYLHHHFVDGTVWFDDVSLREAARD